MADVAGAQARLRAALDQHSQQLAHLIHVVARPPFRHFAIDDVAGRGKGIQRSRRDAALIALLPRDAKIAELQAPLVAHEHVYRRQVAMQHLAAVQLVEDLQDAGDFPPRRLLRERL